MIPLVFESKQLELKNQGEGGRLVWRVSPEKVMQEEIERGDGASCGWVAHHHPGGGFLRSCLSHQIAASTGSPTHPAVIRPRITLPTTSTISSVTSLCMLAPLGYRGLRLLLRLRRKK